MPTFVTNSIRWKIFNAVAQALECAPELQGIPVMRNPTSAFRVEVGERLIVVRWNGDTLAGTRGQREQRSFRLVVASVANAGPTSDREADAMHEVVAGLMRKLWPSLSSLAANLRPTEQDLSPDLESILIEGALVSSLWNVDYERPIVWPQQ